MKRILKIAALSAVTLAVTMLLSGCIMLRFCTADRFSTEFTLTEADIRAFEDAAADFEAGVKAGQNELIISAKASRFMDTFTTIDTQYAISYLNYCIDTKDEQALADYEFALKAYNDAGNLYNETLKNILLSDSEYAAILFEDWSEDEKELLINNNDNAYRLKEENEKLLIEYRDLDDTEEEWSDAVDEIYFEIVGNNVEIAEEFGFESFYDYASKNYYGRHYTHDEREAFRGYVREYIVPLYRENARKLEHLIEKTDEATVSELKSLMYSDFLESDDIQGYVFDYIEGYYTGDFIDLGIGPNMDAMFYEGRAVFASGENSHPVAYTTYLSAYAEPVAYFGPGYHDMLTVVHEMGHYAAFSRYGMTGAPVDFCEVHSQGNEWIFVASLEEKLEPEVYELLVLLRLTDGLERIILATAVDECEERIYSEENIDSADKIAQLIAESMALYGEEIAEEMMLEKYFRYVAAENPVYYFSYAISEIVSMEYYVTADESLDVARAEYESFVDASFDPQSEAEGLTEAFDVETFKSLSEKFAAADYADSGENNSVNDVVNNGENGDEVIVPASFDERILPAA